MPLPTPKKKNGKIVEKQTEFISRCMGNETMLQDFKSQPQRAAVCYAQWKNAHKKKSTASNETSNLILDLLSYSLQDEGDKEKSNED